MSMLVGELHLTRVGNSVIIRVRHSERSEKKCCCAKRDQWDDNPRRCKKVIVRLQAM